MTNTAQSTQRSAVVEAFLNTDELAAALRVKRQTIAASLCRNGHYMGLKPRRLPNGRLLWSTADVERLTGADA